MPITTIGSYLPTMQEFINHWTQVNAVLGASPLLLQGGYALANFTADRDALQTALVAIPGADNVRTNMAGDRDIKKSALRPRLSQFNSLVRGAMPASQYARSLPRAPSFQASESAFLQPFDDMANLWSQINAAPPAGYTGPLLLPRAYALAAFNTELTALRTAYRAASDGAQNARIVRNNRNILLAPIRSRLLQYRRVVPGRLPAGHALLLSIPAYSPPPGSTPEAVSLSGEWSAALGKGVLTWTESDNPALDFYSIRFHPGPKYKAEEEETVDKADPGETTFETLHGLAAPGSTALFRVYVVLTTGNEKGSNTAKIIRA